MSFYHEGMRTLQDRYEGRTIADRLAKARSTGEFTDVHRTFIETAPFFFLSTASEKSVDCSFKGGEPGFVRIVGEKQIAWPDYDGNRMYRSLGNILVNPRVGLLFIRFDGKLIDNAARLRVNGLAEIDESPEAIEGLPGAKRLIRVTAEHVFYNCPRYIPNLAADEASVYIPREGYTPPEPAWKSMDFVTDVFESEKSPNKGE